MKKIKLILIILFLIFEFGCQKKEIDCGKFCAIPERHELYQSFEIEKQFQYFRACPCWGDSISEKYLFAGEISNNEQIIDFLLEKLRTENDEEVLTDSVELLRYVVSRKNLKGRKDISDLVDAAINRIPEKDERSFPERILGGERQSRKERLSQLAKEINEKTQ